MIIRESLETSDEARAELLRDKIGLEVARRDARFNVVDIPESVIQHIGDSFPANLEKASKVETPSVVIAPPECKQVLLDDAVAAYLRFIASDNAKRHVANKISMLRRFLGKCRVQKITGITDSTGKGRICERSAVAFFSGEYELF